MPIYDQEETKRPSRGSECDSVRVMRFPQFLEAYTRTVERKDSERSLGVIKQRKQAPASLIFGQIDG